VIVLPGSCDKNSFEKRNRKKRAAIATTLEKIMPKLIMDDFIENFHTDHLRKIRFKQFRQVRIPMLIFCNKYN
jgi:hypothetical protein